MLNAYQTVEIQFFNMKCHCFVLQPDNQTAEPKRLKSIRKEELSDLLEGNASPCGRLESAPAEASAKSVKVTTEVLPSGQTDDAVVSNYIVLC